MAGHLARRDGVLADWDDDRGFGFITPTGGGPRAFVHVSAFPRGGRPRAGLRVTYAESRDERNRPQATAVKYAGPAPGPRRHGLRPGVLAASLFLLVVAALAWLGQVPVWLPVGYAALSLVTMVVYRADKAAATAGTWRTSEATLHLLALLGGWPGGLVARHLFRHKTTKQPFVTVFWLTVVVNTAVLVWVAAGMPASVG